MNSDDMEKIKDKDSSSDVSDSDSNNALAVSVIGTKEKSTDMATGQQKSNLVAKETGKSSTNHLKESLDQGKGAYGLPSRLDDDVAFPTDIKLERPDDCVPEEDKEYKVCVVCGERASGYYFGALVCLPCKSFYIRCTKDGDPNFTCQCNGNCDIAKQGRIRCQYCRYQRCLMAGMCRKEKPETVQPADGQVLCKVCGDIANGIHFGVNTCEGCKKFFRRGLVENQSYLCKSEKLCAINPRNRNNCRYCRYQKCINVGMSREAIKMGRPKKADTTDQNSNGISDSNLTSDINNESASPKSIHHHDNIPSPNSEQYSPSSSPARASIPDMNCNVNMFDLSKVKTEPVSCEMEQQNSFAAVAHASQSESSYLPMTTAYSAAQSSNWTTPAYTHSRGEMCGSHGNWHQQIVPSVAQQQTLNESTMSHSQTLLTSSSVDTMTTTAPAVHESLFAEDDMDDILAYLSQDQETKGNKKSCYHGYSEQNVQQPDNFSQSSSQQSPCMVENRNPAIKFPVPTDKQFEQQIHNFNSHLIQNDAYRQLSVDTSSPPVQPQECAMSPSMYPGSPSQQQQQQQYPSSAAHTQQYGSSPAHSAQFSPNSPVQYGPHSPSHYSPSSPPQYQTSPYPHSPSSCQYQNSPLDGSHFNSNSPVSQCPGSPVASSQYSSSPVNTCQYSGRNMYNQPGFSQGSTSYQQNCGAFNSPPGENNFLPYLDIKAQMRINQMFISCNALSEDFTDVDDCQGKGMSREEFDNSIIQKTLSMPSYRGNQADYNVSPGSSPLSYHDSSDDSQDGSFCHIRSQNKRKTFDGATSFSDPYNCYFQQNQKDFQCEQYSMLRSKAYWNQPVSYNGQTSMSEDNSALINHLVTEYQKFKDCCDESKIRNNKMLEEVQWPIIGQGEHQHWSHVQRRIIRNTVGFVDFVRSIPGFESIHHQDVSTLCALGSFQLAFIISATEFFVPEHKRFLYFWNWTVSPNNPMYFFKLNLIQCGDLLNSLKMSEVERALFCTLSFLGTDLMNMVDPDTVESIRQRIIDILQAHLYAQGIDPVKRLQELLRVMPQVRHIVMWHKQLMKKMRVNMEAQEVHQLFHDLNLEASQQPSQVGWSA